MLLGVTAPAAAAPTPSPSSEVLRGILAGFVSPNPAVRARAAEQAGQSHRPLFVGPLLSRCRDPQPAVQAAAVRALGEIGVPNHSQDLLRITAALDRAADDPVDQVAEAALDALARFPFPEVRRRLVDRARDPGVPAERRALARAALSASNPAEAEARLRAYLALSQAEASADLAVDPPAELRWGVPSNSLLAAARDLLSPEASRHWGAVQSLATHPELDARFPFLVYALQEPAAANRRLAAGALAQEGDVRAARALASSLADPDPQVRQSALQGVSARNDPVSAGLLVDRLRYETEPTLRQAVGAALREQPEGPTLDAMTGLLEQVTGPVALDAVHVIGARTSTQATELLVAWLARSRDSAERELCISYLTEHPDGQVVPAALRALSTLPRDGGQRSPLVRILRGRQHPDLSPGLLAMLEAGDAGPGVIELLRAQPEAEVRPTVLRLLSHPDAPVRDAALTVGSGYTGQDALQAAEAALDVDPSSARAFALLEAQDHTALLPVRLRLLADDRFRARHSQLLAALHDTRDPGLPEPVAHAVSTRPELAGQAIELLSQQPPEPAIAALGVLATAPALSEGQRAEATRTIAGFGRSLEPDAVSRDKVEAALLPLAKSEATPVRYAARNALHTLDPATYPSWDPYGRIPLIVEGAALGATFMVLATDIADADLSRAFVGGAGAVLGGATPFLLTLSEDVTLGDAGVFGSYSLWGTGAGLGLGLATDMSRRDRLWMTIAGEALGVGAGALALSQLEWGLDDVAFANFTAMQAGLLSGGITAMILDGDSRRNEAAVGVGLLTGAASLVPLAFFTRGAQVEDDLGLLSTAMVHGAWLGTFAPGIFFKDGLTAQRAGLGAAMGQSAGYLAGLVWAQAADLRAEDAVWSAMGGAIGASALGGLGLMLDGTDSRVRYGLVEAGSAAGALALGLVGRKLEFHENDVWLITLLGLGGAVMGSDFSVRLEEERLAQRSTVGGVLMGAGFGTAAGLVASQFVDLSDRTLLRTVMGGAIGAAAGTGLGRMVPGLDVHDRSKISGAFTAVGLALTLPWAENLKLSGRNWAYGAASGAVVGGLMSLTPYHYNEGVPPGSQVGSGLLFGSAVGTFAGLAVAQSLDLNLKQTGLATLATIAATGFGGGLGLVIPDQDRSLPVGLAQGLGLATFATASGLLAADIWKTSGPKKPGGGFASFLRLSDLAAHGALHGALIPMTWRATGEAVPKEEVFGGLMLGASSGVLLGLGARGLGAPRLSPADLAETSLMTTAVYSMAGGLGLAFEDRRLGMALVHGLGLPAYAAAWYASPHTEYDRQTPWTLTLGVSSGAWMGTWMAQLLANDAGAKQLAGGAVTGAGLGAIVGAAWSQWQPDRQEGEVFIDGIFGGTLGGGLALALGSGQRGSAAWIEGGTALGLGLGVALSPHTRFDGGDRALVTLSTMLGAWHGAWTPELFESSSARRQGGAAAIGASVGFAAGSVAAQFSDLQDVEVVEMGLITTAADVMGGGLALALPGLARPGRTAVLQGAGVAGLVAGAWLAPRTRYVIDDSSLITLTSGFGALVGGLAPNLGRADPEGQVRLGAILAGMGGGTLLGVALSQTHRLQLGDQVETLLWGSAGTAMGGGAALLSVDPSRQLTAALVGGGAALGLAGGLIATPYSDLSAADRGLLGLSTGLGAWHGAWLSSLWGDASAQGRAGGALLGMGAGWVAGALAAPYVEMTGAEALQGGLIWGAGTGLGAGLGLLLPKVGPEATAGLMQGLGAAGLATGIIFSDRLKLEGGDLALVPAGALLGAGLGLTLPAFVADGSGQGAPRGAGVLLGASAGLLAAGAVAQFVEPSFDDVLEASLTSVFAQGLGLGLGLMIPDSGEKLRFALLDGLGAAGLAAGLWLAPKTEYGEGAGMTLALGASLGAGLGMLTPGYWNGADLGDVPRAQLGGGALVGASLGLATSVALNQVWQITPTTRNHAALGASLGGLTGGGFGLLLSRDDRVAAGLTQGLATAGAVALGATLKDFDYDKGDLALGGAYVSYLTWHAMGLTLLLDGSDRQAAGVAVGTVALGALTGMYLAPYIDMTLSDTLMLLAGNVWGTWIGGWGGQLLEDALGKDLQGRRQAGLTLLATVLGSDVGLALTGMVVGGILDVPPTQFAYINLAGLSGMLLGMVGAGFAKGEPLKAGNVLGSLSGLVVGAIVTSFFDWSGSPTWDQILSRRRAQAEPQLAKADLPKPQGPTGFGVEQWMPSAQVSPSPEGDPMYLFTVSGVFR